MLNISYAFENYPELIIIQPRDSTMLLNGLDISRLSAELSRTVDILNNLAMI